MIEITIALVSLAVAVAAIVIAVSNARGIKAGIEDGTFGESGEQ